MVFFSSFLKQVFTLKIVCLIVLFLYLTSCGNYLVTQSGGIEISSKYSSTSGIRAWFSYLIVGVLKMAEEKYIKMVTLKEASDWHYWKVKMIDHLYSKYYFELITVVKLAEMTDKYWDKLER